MNRWLAWVLGWISSDGCLQKPKRVKDVPCITFCILEKDRDVLDKMKMKIMGRSRVRVYNYDDKATACYSIYDKSIVYLVQELDIRNHAPNLEEYRWDYIRGVFEGDGCFYIRKKNNSFNTMFYGKLNHLSYISRIISEDLQYPYRKPKDYGSHTHNIRYEGRIARLIAWKMYNGVHNNISMNRKRAIYSNYSRAHIHPAMELPETLSTFLKLIEVDTLQTRVQKKGFSFFPSGIHNLENCKRIQEVLYDDLCINSAICKPGKGKKKRYEVYIPFSELANTPASNQLDEGIVQ